MRLSDALSPERIALSVQAAEKDSAILELVELACTYGIIADRELYTARVLERESLLSTGLEYGIAVPHAQAEGIEGVFCCLGISRDGVHFDSIDDEPARILCLIAAQEGQDGPYLQLLSHISRIFALRELREQILDARTPAEILEVIRRTEEDLEERRVRT